MRKRRLRPRRFVIRSAALGTLALAVVVGAKTLTAIHATRPLREVDFTVPTGRTARVKVRRLEPLRRYELTLTMSSADEGRIDVQLGEEPDALETSLDASHTKAQQEVTASSQGTADVKVKALGEIGSTYYCRLEWKPLPSPRMASAEFVRSPNQGVRP